MPHITSTITIQQVANYKMKQGEENKLLVVKHFLNYGQHYFYPVNDSAQKLLKLTGKTKKAFTSDQIEILKGLGYQIEIQPMVGIDAKND